MKGKLSKLLVTGANGFIGARLCEALRGQGNQIRTLGRSPDPHSEDHRLMDLAIDQCPPDLLNGVSCNDPQSKTHKPAISASANPN